MAKPSKRGTCWCTGHKTAADGMQGALLPWTSAKRQELTAAAMAKPLRLPGVPLYTWD